MNVNELNFFALLYLAVSPLLVTGTRADNIMGMHSTDREIERRRGRILEAEKRIPKRDECIDHKSQTKLGHRSRNLNEQQRQRTRRNTEKKRGGRKAGRAGTTAVQYL